MKKADMYENIGQGAYADVYKVIYRDQEYALKVNRQRDNNYLDTLKELDILLKVSHHEKFVKIHRYSTNYEDNIAIMLNKGEGSLLKLYIDNAKLLQKNIKDIIFDILCALEYLHYNNIIHGDIKLDNIIYDIDNDYDIIPLTEEDNQDDFIDIIERRYYTLNDSLFKVQIEGPYTDEVLTDEKHQHDSNTYYIRKRKKYKAVLKNTSILSYLSDFGLSQYYNHQEKFTDVICTVNYRPIEVYMNDPYDFKVDVWSVGVLFYELYTGYIFNKYTDIKDHIKFYLESLNVDDFYMNKVMNYYDIKTIKKNNVINSIQDETIKDLIDNMLQCNPMNRYTVKQCLEHEYFKDKRTILDSIRKKYNIGFTYHNDYQYKADNVILSKSIYKNNIHNILFFISNIQNNNNDEILTYIQDPKIIMQIIHMLDFLIMNNIKDILEYIVDDWLMILACMYSIYFRVYIISCSKMQAQGIASKLAKYINIPFLYNKDTNDKYLDFEIRIINMLNKGFVFITPYDYYKMPFNRDMLNKYIILTRDNNISMPYDILYNYIC